MLKIHIYHLFRYFEYTRILFPVMLSVLKLWSESIGCKISISVCREKDVDLNTNADVIGISVYTQTAPAAYRIGEKLRKRGKILILGGPHFNSDHTLQEGATHCDVLVKTICEEQWKEVLYSIKENKIAPQQKKAEIIIDSENQFRYPNNLHKSFNNLKWHQIPVVPTSLGCPYDCDFCTPYLKGKYRLRDITAIYNDISNARGRLIGICDANFGLNKRHTIELMKAIAPLKKQLWVQTTIGCLKDKEFLDIIALGGVRWIGVGIETLSIEYKKHGGKDIKINLDDIIDYAHKKGMYIQGNFICGLDCDEPESFDMIYDFYTNSNLNCIFLEILVPYPTTRLYDTFLKEGRILDSNWEHYDYRHLVYKPKKMTIDQLVNGYVGLYRQITSSKVLYCKAKGIYFLNGVSISSSAALLFNLATRVDARKKYKLYKKNITDISKDHNIKFNPTFPKMS
jgi:radical SAM superfamily enzyme YgiQ (UPF0313 family)